MIAFITIIYASLYFLLFNVLGVVKKTVANIAIFAGIGVAIVATIVFMWYTYAPMTSDARMFRFVIPIVPNVKGEVVEVPIDANVPIAEGETLFRIDPTPYEFTVRQLEAQIRQQEAEKRLAEINVDRARKLVTTQAAAQVDLDIWVANLEAAAAAIEASRASLDKARWQLAETDVQAPHDGYVVNLQLRPGGYVTTVPLASSMAFVSTEANIVLASFSQSAVRRIAVDDPAEVVFANRPGQTYPGTVKRVVGVGGEAQLQASSQLPTLTGTTVSSRWGVVIELDDEEVAKQMPQSTSGTLAVYTRGGAAFHIISKVALRMNAWLGYLTSP